MSIVAAVNQRLQANLELIWPASPEVPLGKLLSIVYKHAINFALFRFKEILQRNFLSLYARLLSSGGGIKRESKGK